jgi:Na+:H+ antiporter, NhaC family
MTRVEDVRARSVVDAVIPLFWEPPATDMGDTGVESTALADIYWITSLDLMPLLLLVVRLIRRTTTSLALAAAALTAGVLGVFTLYDDMPRYLQRENPTPGRSPHS